MTKLQLTPLFVELVAQNLETNLILQLTTHVCVIVAPNPNESIRLTNLCSVAKLTFFRSAKDPRSAKATGPHAHTTLPDKN
jgi:hypothetical protein